jgi:hypothetical protein
VIEMKGSHSTVAMGRVGIDFDHLISTKGQQERNMPGNAALSSSKRVMCDQLSLSGGSVQEGRQ